MRVIPDDATLAAGLTAVLATDVTVLARRANIYTSTYPTEMVSCRTAEGRDLALFCKYGPRRITDGHGHRNGFSYEAFVHRAVLHRNGGGPPRYHGSFPFAESSLALVFDELIGAARATWAPRNRGVYLTAAWLGRFHATHTFDDGAAPPHALRRYSLAYYLGWAQRTQQFAGRAGARLCWLTQLCDRFPALADILVTAPQCLIHGEFYPHNILMCDGAVRPVDWETAAIGPGEIDLATLTEGWPESVATRCAAVYAHARWRGRPPVEFAERLFAARVYLHLRWLGDTTEWEEVERASGRWTDFARLVNGRPLA